MKRKEKEITDRSVIDSIIQKSTVCRLALCQNNHPYIVPICFGYDGKNIYIHSSSAGQKIDMINANNSVCLEFDIDNQAVESDKACNWSMEYKSVIAIGKAFFIETTEAKKKALAIVMNQYSDKTFEFPDKVVDKTTIIKIEIESITGKHSG